MILNTTLPRLIRRGRRASKRRVIEFFDRRPRLHFLHLGKNAGTQIKAITNRVDSAGHPARIVTHPHNVTLKNLPQADPYFFSIRNPITRFRSGFYSRKRKGRPHFSFNWTPNEAIAFHQFEDANDLAEALFAPNDTGAAAARAMMSIQHVAMHQHHWFNLHGQFLNLRPPVHIIRQEHFDTDIEMFLRKIGAPSDVYRKKTRTATHRNDYAGIPPLSDLAISNLERWYAADLEFYRDCEKWILDNNTAGTQ